MRFPSTVAPAGAPVAMRTMPPGGRRPGGLVRVSSRRVLACFGTDPDSPERSKTRCASAVATAQSSPAALVGLARKFAVVAPATKLLVEVLGGGVSQGKVLVCPAPVGATTVRLPQTVAPPGAPVGCARWCRRGWVWGWCCGCRGGAAGAGLDGGCDGGLVVDDVRAGAGAGAEVAVGVGADQGGVGGALAGLEVDCGGVGGSVEQGKTLMWPPKLAPVAVRCRARMRSGGRCGCAPSQAAPR